MNAQEKVWKVGQWVGILLVVFLAVLSVKELKSIGEPTNFINTITVNGSGEALAIPDIATFSFTVNETAKTVKEAQDLATQKINTTLSAVKDKGVSDKDIKTLSYSINPHYERTQVVCITYPCPQGKSTMTGYDVSQTVQVKIRDLSKAGEIFETIGGTGVTNVNGLSFSIDDIEDIKSDARALAIADAREKAEKIADDLGVRLVKITGFYDSTNYPMAYSEREAFGGDAMVMKASNAPEIPQGEQKVTADVSVTYEIR